MAAVAHVVAVDGTDFFPGKVIDYSKHPVPVDRTKSLGRPLQLQLG